MILRLQSVIAVFMCSCLISVAASTSSSIGLVMTSGEVQVDGVRVPGTSAIFSGNLIYSGDRTANVQFSDGTSAVLRPGATLAVYRERTVLQQGVAMQRGVYKHAVLADSLRISGASPSSVAVVSVKDGSHVEVAAQDGESDVRAPSGDLVARVEPGKVLSFAISQAAETQEKTARLCGTLQQNYQLTDAFTNVTYQLQGSGLEPFVGKTVRVTGTIPATNPPPSPEVLSVSSIKKQNRPCEAAAGYGAAPAVAGATWAKGAIVILIFGALGATLIGLGAAGAFGVSQPPVTPAAP